MALICQPGYHEDRRDGSHGHGPRTRQEVVVHGVHEKERTDELAEQHACIDAHLAVRARRAARPLL